MKERSLKDLFHLIGKVLPADQGIPLMFSPETLVSEALSVSEGGRSCFNALRFEEG